jgi:hypothetical protein
MSLELNHLLMKLRVESMKSRANTKFAPTPQSLYKDHSASLNS